MHHFQPEATRELVSGSAASLADVLGEGVSAAGWEASLPRAVRSHGVVSDDGYSEWARETRHRWHGTQPKAAVGVNSERLLFNWQLNRDPVLRKDGERREENLQGGSRTSGASPGRAASAPWG